MKRVFTPSPLGSRTVHPNSRDRASFDETMTCVCCGSGIKHAVVTQYGTFGLSCYASAIGLPKAPASMAVRVAKFIRLVTAKRARVVGLYSVSAPGSRVFVGVKVQYPDLASPLPTSDVIECIPRDADTLEALLKAAFGLAV